MACTPAFSQTDTLVVQGLGNEKDRLDIREYMKVYEYGHKTRQFDFVRTEAHFVNFSDFNSNVRRSQPVWIKLIIRNQSASRRTNLVLYLGNRIIEEMYQEIGGVLTHNSFADTISRSRPFTTLEGQGLPVAIGHGKTATLWVRSTDMLFESNFNPVLFSVTAYGDFKKEHSFGRLFHYSYLCLVMGLCLFLGLIAFIQSVYSRDAAYFFWALYLWSNFIMFFAALDYTFEMALISNDKHPWTIVSQFIVQVFYLLFLNSFLEIRKHNLKTFRLSIALIFLLLVIIVFASFTVSSGNYQLRGLADSLTFVTALLILLLFVRIVKVGIPQTKLLVIGSFGVLLTGVEAALFDQFDLNHFGIFWLDPFVCFSLGVIFELIFFSLALSRRMLLIEQENHRLQQDYTKHLEVDLAKRISTIQTQNSLLEEQRVQRLTNEFEQKIAETEITALRSQMNPHFIFNCLNSIKLYTMENKSEAASDYLTKFSRLIRLVLENSRSEKVTLENELETLSLYAEMEVMRFKNKLHYKLTVEPEIDQLFIEVPPLLLQPFVENAIWHGLMHKEEGGMVSVDVTMPTDKFLHIEITDNGVGRKKSAEYKSKSATVRKSFGMKVTNDRIELINHIYKTATLVTVVDLEDENQQSIGTKVIIEIPL